MREEVVSGLLGRRALLGLGLGTATGMFAACEPDGRSSEETAHAPTVDSSSSETPVALEDGVFRSRFLRSRLGWAIAAPGNTGAGLPVLLYLHGLGADHTSPFTYMGLDAKLESWVAAGGTPFAIATVDGLDSWWRPQPGGIDGSRMLIEEFLPLLARRGFDIDTISLAGASMGGYGALRLAGNGRLAPHSVGVFAPAVGPSGGAGSTDVSRHPEMLRGIPVQLFVGRYDEWRRDDLAYVHGLRQAGVRVQAHLIPGGHDPVEMSVAAPRLIRYAGKHLRTAP